jgi:ribosome-associated toxin RatA of RatAB toxin-antitoxin module
MKHIARSAIVERSAAELYALVEDIESYPDFLPWCASATVQERSAGRTVATLTVSAKGLKQSITTENLNTPGSAIQMKLRKGPFKHFNATWRFTALEAHAAKIEFSLEYEFSSRIVARALEPVFSRIADNMVEAFTQRASTQS